MNQLFSATLLVLVISNEFAFAAEARLPHVPDAFHVEKVAGSPLVKFPMMAGFDETGRLFVAESSGENQRAEELLLSPQSFIRLLEDSDGDGHFDTSTIFADELTLPMGALWYRDALYVASPPYIWKLRDTNGDGIADERTILVESFGFSGNAASIHGCFLSPEGRIYWCDGRHGHEHFDEEGRLVSKGKAARLFSCRPDGSDVRVFCGGGMDNPVEVDFTETGDVIGTVNILHGRPRIDALVHWIEHGVYPRADQGDSIAEFSRTGELIPPIARLGHVAVSGTTRYRSEQFGAEYRDNFFISLFNTHQVIRSVVTPSGSTYTSREEEFLVSDDPNFHPTDVLEDADGSLLVIDTGGWFRIGCPASEVAKPEFHGGIYRISRTDALPLADPRGLTIDWKQATPARLLVLLDDERFAVRERAIDELSQRDTDLASLAATTPRQQRNLLWAAARSDHAISPLLLDRCLLDADSSVRLTALQVLREERQLAPAVVNRSMELLRDGTPAEKRLCAGLLEVASRAKGRTPPRLTESLLAGYNTVPLDRHLEHALTHALISVGDEGTLNAGLPKTASVAMRRNWLLVASSRDDIVLSKTVVLDALKENDPLLKDEAYRVFERHPEWIPEFSGQIRELLQAESLDARDEARIRNVVSTFFDSKEIQQSVRNALDRDSTSVNVRAMLLEIVADRINPSNVASWNETIESSLASPTIEILRHALELTRSDSSGRYVPKLERLAGDPSLDRETRLLAIRASLPHRATVDGETVSFLVDLIGEDENTLLSLRAAETLASVNRLSSIQLDRLANEMGVFPPHALPTLLPFVRATSHLEVQQAYLARVLETKAYDRLADADLVAWKDAGSAGVLRDRIDSILVARERLSVEKKSRLTSLGDLLEGGNPEKGEQVFLSRRSACSGCHRIADNGGQIGPDLSQIGRIRTPADLLEAILYPSSSFARGYEPFTVVTEGGRVHNGVIRRETAGEIELLTTEQRAIRIRREEIELLKSSTVSIMPQDIDKLLSPDELRDLIAFLHSRR